MTFGQLANANAAPLLMHPTPIKPTPTAFFAVLSGIMGREGKYQEYRLT